MSKTKYHSKYSCNKCGGDNTIINVGGLSEGIIEECTTLCSTCNFKDHWAYGFFESGSYMISNCETYSFGE